MLQSPLLIQIIVGVCTLIVFSLCLYFRNKADKCQTDEKKKFGAFYIILLGATAIGTIYFIVNIVATTPLRFGPIVLALLKFIIFVMIGINILFYNQGDDIKDIEFQGLMLVLTLLVSMLVILIPILIFDAVYDSKVEEVEGQKYVEEQFELVPIFNSKEVEGGVNITVSTNTYYNAIVKKVVEENEEKEKIVEYEICYIDNETKEKIYIKLDAEKTAVIPSENVKKAYLLKKTYTSYSIDYNQEPPVECNFKDTYAYEIHVPKEEDSSIAN